MKAYTAIYSIDRGAQASPSVVKPGEVYSFEGAELQRLLDSNAIREATDDEITLAKAKGKIKAGAVSSEADQAMLESQANKIVSEAEKIAAEKIAQAERIAAEKIAQAEKDAAAKIAEAEAATKAAADASAAAAAETDETAEPDVKPTAKAKTAGRKGKASDEDDALDV